MFKITLTLLLVSFSFVENGYSKEETIKTQYGSFKIIDKNSNTVVSAPHGTYDINTGAITSQVCKELDVSCIVATGFVPRGTRINVNRPTEGVGIRSSEEPTTKRSNDAYKTYLDAIKKVTNDNLGWYFEVHGSRVKGMEVALYNLTIGDARAIKKILEEEWSTYSDKNVSIKVQGLSNIKMTGNAVKKFGIVHELQPKFIQFEFSRNLRENKKVLSRFLVGSINRIKNELQ